MSAREKKKNVKAAVILALAIAHRRDAVRKMSIAAAFAGFTTLPASATSRRTRGNRRGARAKNATAALKPTASCTAETHALKGSRRTFFSAAFAATLSSTLPPRPCPSVVSRKSSLSFALVGERKKQNQSLLV